MFGSRQAIKTRFAKRALAAAFPKELVAAANARVAIGVGIGDLREARVMVHRPSAALPDDCTDLGYLEIGTADAMLAMTHAAFTQGCARAGEVAIADGSCAAYVMLPGIYRVAIARKGKAARFEVELVEVSAKPKFRHPKDLANIA